MDGLRDKGTNTRVKELLALLYTFFGRNDSNIELVAEWSERLSQAMKVLDTDVNNIQHESKKMSNKLANIVLDVGMAKTARLELFNTCSIHEAITVTAQKFNNISKQFAKLMTAEGSIKALL